MNKQDKEKYPYSIIEGDEVSGKLAEIQFKRVDGDEISEDEADDLLAELEELFPIETYRLTHETKPIEDDSILHVYISLEREERLRRTKGVLGQRVIVPKSEVVERMNGWFS